MSRLQSRFAELKQQNRAALVTFVTAGDPERAADILVRLSRRTTVPDHLPLGVIAAEGAIRHGESVLADDREWAAVARSADFGEPFPVDLPPER